VYRHEVLTAACRLVLKNKGSPGADGQSCHDIIDGPVAATFSKSARRAKSFAPVVIGRSR
jgi:hypothetical protein